MFSLFLVAGQNLPGNILSRLLLCEQTLKCNRGRQSRASRSRSTKVCAVTAVCQWICLLTMPCGAGSCLVRVPSFKSFACSTMRLCGCICCNPQSRKAFKQRDKCKGVCECGVTGAAKAWLVQCIPCDTTKPRYRVHCHAGAKDVVPRAPGPRSKHNQRCNPLQHALTGCSSNVL
jgi:hypothetical protein